MITFQSDIMTVSVASAPTFRRTFEVDAGEIYFPLVRPGNWVLNGLLPTAGQSVSVFRCTIESPDFPSLGRPFAITEGTRLSLPKFGRYRVIIDLDTLGAWYRSSQGTGNVPEACCRFVAGAGRVSIPQQMDCGSGLIQLAVISNGAGGAIAIPYYTLAVCFLNETNAAHTVQIEDWTPARSILGNFVTVAATNGFVQLPIRAAYVSIPAVVAVGNFYVNAIVQG